MPYLKQRRREELVSALGNGPYAETPGELNYLITMLCTQYINDMGLSYGAINDVVGALECAKLECYRRVAAPYENDKIEQNGDVY